MKLAIEIPKLMGQYSWWYIKQLFRPLKTQSFKELGPLASHFQFIEKDRAAPCSQYIFLYGQISKEIRASPDDSGAN